MLLLLLLRVSGGGDRGSEPQPSYRWGAWGSQKARRRPAPPGPCSLSNSSGTDTGPRRKPPVLQLLSLLPRGLQTPAQRKSKSVCSEGEQVRQVEGSKPNSPSKVHKGQHLWAKILAPKKHLLTAEDPRSTVPLPQKTCYHGACSQSRFDFAQCGISASEICYSYCIFFARTFRNSEGSMSCLFISCVWHSQCLDFFPLCFCSEKTALPSSCRWEGPWGWTPSGCERKRWSLRQETLGLDSLGSEAHSCPAELAEKARCSRRAGEAWWSLQWPGLPGSAHPHFTGVRSKTLRCCPHHTDIFNFLWGIISI